jgi:hypothetical protein
MIDDPNPTVKDVVTSLQISCRTSNCNPCSVKMAGYLHGLLKETAMVPKKYQYSVLEVIFGCEIFTFSQLTFHTCKTLIDQLQGNPNARAMFYTIYKSMEDRLPADHTITPGEFKDFLYVCEGENIYAF